MGRPLDDANFGDTAGGGAQIQCTAVIDSGTGAEACWIMNQKGSRTYTAVAAADSNRTGRVTLIAGTPTNEGEARIAVTPSDGAGGSLTVEYAKNLQAHIVKTWSGNKYEWTLGALVANLDTGQAQVQFA